MPSKCLTCEIIFTIRNPKDKTSFSNKLCGKCYLGWKKEQRKRRGLK